jgi:hypothetical protein
VKNELVRIWKEAIVARVGFVVLTAAVVGCNAVKVKRRFGGTRRLHLKGREYAKVETNVKQLASRILAWLILYP